MSVEVGQEAPSFTLQNQFGEPVSLADYRDKNNVVLMFFPKAFTGTCTDELCAIRDDRADFEAQDAVVLSVSCDTTAVLKKFAELEGLEHNLLSDFWPHGATARNYGVFLDKTGIALRATFIIDRAGVVRWKVVNTPADARSNVDYHKALASL